VANGVLLGIFFFFLSMATHFVFGGGFGVGYGEG
jgi:hypothetical protein